jgi:hypothetical protein
LQVGSVDRQLPVKICFPVPDPDFGRQFVIRAECPGPSRMTAARWRTEFSAGVELWSGEQCPA